MGVLFACGSDGFAVFPLVSISYGFLTRRAILALFAPRAKGNLDRSGLR